MSLCVSLSTFLWAVFLKLILNALAEAHFSVEMFCQHLMSILASSERDWTGVGPDNGKLSRASSLTLPTWSIPSDGNEIMESKKGVTSVHALSSLIWDILQCPAIRHKLKYLLKIQLLGGNHRHSWKLHQRKFAIDYFEKCAFKQFSQKHKWGGWIARNGILIF